MRPMRGGGGDNGKPQPINRATLKRVIRLFAPYRSQVAWIGVMVLAGAALTLAPPFLLQKIINDGVMRGNLSVVMNLSLLSLIITLVGIAANLGYGYMSIVVGQNIMRDLRNRLFEHLQAMSLRFFTSTRTGEIQSRLANDVGGVQSVVSDTAANLLSNVVMVVSAIVGMVILDWRLTLLSVGVTPLFAMLAAQVGEKARVVRKRSQEQLADLNSTMAETLSVSGALLTKTSGRQALTSARFAKTNEALTHTNVHMAMIFRAFGAIFGLTFSVTPVLVYWLAGYLIVGHKDPGLSIGTIVAFTALQGRMFFPLTGLLNVQVELGSAMALFDRIFEYLDMPLDIVDSPNAIDLDPATIRGDIEFKNVGFRYDLNQEQPTLENINLTAQSGQLVALVGASGAGKTTLTYLIPRLYDADSGQILIDGNDVKSVTLASIGKCVAVVTQETYLVHDTIRENLRYGKPEASNEDIENAAKAAAIHDHIVSLPEGYETVVGERGYKLSGGEKQRISIARAILKNPRILILDEATSALDTQSERLVQSALAKLMEGRTTFAIAHRLTTIQSADQIVVMQKGRVVEQGTHQELLALNGEYSRLHQLGFEDEPVPAISSN